MYRIIFNYQNENIPPILTDLNGNPISKNGYIVGSLNDPHWKPYPKSEYPGIRHRLPITYAITDYQYDNDHYAMYVSEQFGPTMEYSILLKNHFESVHKYSYQIMKENKAKLEEQSRLQNEMIKKQNKEKTVQLKKLLLEQEKNLKMLDEEFKKTKLAADRYVRNAKRSGMSQEEAQRAFIIENPKSEQLANTISVIKSNIVSLKNELKTYR